MSLQEKTIEIRPSVQAGVGANAPALGNTLSVLLVVLLSMNLRPLLTSVAPLLRNIQSELSISNFWISILVTLPVVCLGVFGPLAAPLVRRLGVEGVLLVALTTSLAGAIIRSFGLVPLFLGTVMIAAGISLLGVLTPVLIKRDFTNKVGPMMGLFAMVLGLGAAVSTGVSVPITDALGGSWRAGLSIWMAPVVIAAIVVIAMLRSGQGQGHTRSTAKIGIMHDPMTWQLMGFFALMASSAYAIFSWGPSMLAARGLDPKTCGFIMSAVFVAQMPSGFLVPIIAGKMRDQRLITAIIVVLMTVGLVAFLFAPVWSLSGVAAVLGIGQGGGFAMALTLIVLRAGNPQIAAKLSSVVQSVGYVVGGLAGPFAVGLIHDMTEGWSSVAVFFAAVGGISLVLGLGASRDRMITVS